MLTRAKISTITNPTFQSLPLASCTLFDTTKPKFIKIALSKPHRVSAMHEELQALRSNGTWVLVPRKSNMNVVGSRWMFKTKFHFDGFVERFKARLVAKGYNQIEGVYFDDTFSPVVKAATIRVVLSIIIALNWDIKQLNVKNAFLHGDLKEKVFMEQPPRFRNPIFPNHVCLLKKAIYALKQAPKYWFYKFSSYLFHLGFLCSKADSSLFVQHSSEGTILLLLYVDDIILTGSNSFLLSRILYTLQSHFATKDLGPLHYFLGIEVYRDKDGLFLSQHTYATAILQLTDMLVARAHPTPLSQKHHLHDSTGSLVDASEYRSLVGA